MPSVTQFYTNSPTGSPEYNYQLPRSTTPGSPSGYLGMMSRLEGLTGNSMSKWAGPTLGPGMAEYLRAQGGPAWQQFQQSYEQVPGSKNWREKSTAGAYTNTYGVGATGATGGGVGGSGSGAGGGGTGVGGGGGVGAGGDNAAKAQAERDAMFQSLQDSLASDVKMRDHLRGKLTGQILNPTDVATQSSDTIEAARKTAMAKLRGDKAVMQGVRSGGMADIGRQIDDAASRQQVAGRRDARVGVAGINEQAQQAAMSAALQLKSLDDAIRLQKANYHAQTAFYDEHGLGGGGGGGGSSAWGGLGSPWGANGQFQYGAVTFQKDPRDTPNAGIGAYFNPPTVYSKQGNHGQPAQQQQPPARQSAPRGVTAARTATGANPFDRPAPYPRGGSTARTGTGANPFANQSKSRKLPAVQGQPGFNPFVG